MAAMALDSCVAITLGTLSGNSYELQLPAQACALDGKCQLADELGRPADLQRWLLNGNILEDDDVLAGFQTPDSKIPLEVLCVFLPHTFDVKVKVIKFSPGSQAQSVKEVFISVSPTMTVDAAKFEALSSAAIGLGEVGSVEVATAARFIKGGLHLADDKTMEHYHIDPESSLHLIVPRGRKDFDKDEMVNVSEAISMESKSSGSSSECDEARMLTPQETQMFEEFWSKTANKDDVIKSSEIREEAGKGAVSPRTLEAASMFNTMGVHRLRRRRSASTPVLSRAASEESFGVDAGKSTASSTRCSDTHAPAAEKETNPMKALRLDAPTPQKPSEPKVSPPRPCRGRPSSRANSRVQRNCEDIRPKSPTGQTRPPTSKCSGSMRPPRAPTATASVEGAERPIWTSRGQRSSNVVPLHPGCDQGLKTHSASSATSSWVCEWASQSTASRAQSLPRPAKMARSSSCRPAGIDRFHYVACC